MARNLRLLLSLAIGFATFGYLPLLSHTSLIQAADHIHTLADCTRNGLADAINAADDGDVIQFDCDPSPATIDFSADGEITIGKTVTINGADQITLDGGENSQIFTVTSDGDLTLENITLTNGVGPSSGAIYNGGALTITDSIFSDNFASFGSAGAIDNGGGTVTITNSTFSNNSANLDGGAIHNAGGAITITNSTFSNNSADGGGAISNADTITITNSTFSGNSADFGGAISNLQRTITITNSTFSGNSADSGGAIFINVGDVTVTASILANNGENCEGAAGSGGYNLTDDASCGFGATGDIENGNANLGSLADNGGPTPTVLPLPPSDAIDAIPTDFCTDELPETDQRGVTRPQLDACDIGAVEVQLSEIPEQILCANRYNGDLRMPRTDVCASTEMLFEMPADGPLDLCVNRYNGDTRYSRTGACASTETAIEVRGLGEQPVCVNRYNGDVRVPRVEGQCASTEMAQTL